MTLAQTANLVAAARQLGTGVLAFNAISLEHLEGIIAGAEAAARPVILQVSENAAGYHGGDPEPLAAAAQVLAKKSALAIALHLDHVEDHRLLYRAHEAGFSSVMIDASKLDYADNVRATRDGTSWAHGQGLYVEAELGAVGGKGGAHTPGVRTDPQEAVSYVAETGVDALAVAVGSSHAMTERSATLDLNLIRALRDAVSVPLVLHGSSGVADDHLREAIDAGIVKINVGTALNVAFTAGVNRSLQRGEQVIDPRSYLGRGRDALAAEVERLLRAIVRLPQSAVSP